MRHWSGNEARRPRQPSLSGLLPTRRATGTPSVIEGLAVSTAVVRVPCGSPRRPARIVPGCRGRAPTEAPHTRWRRFRPGTGRAAMGGSATGPAITLDNRSWRRAIKVATSITSAGPAGKPFLAALVLQRFRGCSDRAFPRSWPIIRRHSCACAAVSDSQARSCGSSSRPSGVTSRPPLNEKPAQGPVSFRSRTIRLHARVGAGDAARVVPASPGAS